MSRLDVYLVENGIAKSRERAKVLIKESKVTVNQTVCTKASREISKDDRVTCDPDDLSYVGRGGLKLRKALEVFDLDINGAVCVDIGASTGGFTQCLLEHGAKKVYAVDVGHGQLDSSLVNDKRVVNLEGVNARELDSSIFVPVPQFASIDVSFISLSLIIKPVCDVLVNDGSIIALIKPQFEAGKQALNKKGIVKDKKDHVRVIERLISEFSCAGLAVLDIIPSAVTGGDGNIEYLTHLTKQSVIAQKSFDIKGIVESAFSLFRSDRS